MNRPRCQTRTGASENPLAARTDRQPPSPEDAEALAADGGTVCTGAQRTRHIASSLTDPPTLVPVPLSTCSRRAIVGILVSCTLERSGGHFGCVSGTRSLAFLPT
ncbi:hypothetical protein HPB51_026869 [Rhipicephalus microplus]|uniref:Uncharacterized protein n=1 Tax=Rhipicephalus microplus TaxID=6941 RepID=A0A9J6D1H7_RHIMP|nr:hypothetical protein HPB51_026869 [Rhipicephalus microplus]